MNPVDEALTRLYYRFKTPLVSRPVGDLCLLEVSKLADYVLTNFADEIADDESAVDVAIRLLSRLK